jgi:hypothetical protein
MYRSRETFASLVPRFRPAHFALACARKRYVLARLARRAAAGQAGLTVAALALSITGCGGATQTTPVALKLEREDLAVVARALNALERPTMQEVAATKASWPLIANGLPADVASVSRSPALARAARTAAQLRLPAPFGEARARTLTGPASQIVGLFRSYALLSERGWKLLLASIAQIETGAPATAHFARANAPLYLESVYDAHFTLAQIGKKLLAGYKKLGGASAFGTALAPALLERLARTYSEASARLHPHVGVRLGS